MNANQEKRKWPRWAVRLAGALSVFISVFSILLSVAMPGIGWVIAAINLAATCVLTPRLGRTLLGTCLVITVVHLFLFGPLSGGQSPFSSPFFSAIFVFAPILAALATILAPEWQTRRR